MAPLLLAEVWTYWISFFLLVPAVAMAVAIAIGYLVKVERQKHPRR